MLVKPVRGPVINPAEKVYIVLNQNLPSCLASQNNRLYRTAKIPANKIAAPAIGPEVAAAPGDAVDGVAVELLEPPDEAAELVMVAVLLPVAPEEDGDAVAVGAGVLLAAWAEAVAAAQNLAAPGRTCLRALSFPHSVRTQATPAL